MLLCLPEHDERGIFSDIHAERHALCDGRQLVIIPDIIADFRRLPFEASSFSVVFLIPHILNVSDQTDGTVKKYGKLDWDNWGDDLRAGVREAF